MTRKRRRLLAVLAGLAALGTAAFLVLSAFQDNLVFFYSPSDLAAKHVPEGRRLRLGGLVEAGSVKREDGGRSLSFRVTDGAGTVAVTYAGVVPDLFREGQGVVAEGALDHDGVFRAATVLAKHDERYMPPEVAAALKKAGRWREGEGGAPGSAPGSAVGSTIGSLPVSVPGSTTATSGASAAEIKR